MVVDTMENLEKYVSLNPLFEEVVKFIREHDLMALEVGKHPIKGDDLFLNIALAKGKTEEEAVFETHRRMLDIQIPLDAPEAYGYMPLADLPEAEYNDAKDITKYPGVASPNTCQLQAWRLRHLLATGRTQAMHRLWRNPEGNLQG